VAHRKAAWLVPLAALLLAAADGTPAPSPPPLNGFVIEHAQVDPARILAGGPPRDGIRSVDAPRFAAPPEATWVKADTPVLGVALGHAARAYPVHLMEWHEVVNDAFGDTPIAVTYDPLTGVPRAFVARAGDRNLHFGVSGLIYESGLLMYDRETESLWSQFTGQALSGPLAGTRLQRIRIRQEDMASWYARHPDTVVLERPEPKRIDYRYSPYEAYWTQDSAPFPVDAEDRRFHAKELVVGVVVGGHSRAYLGSILTREGGRAEDVFQGKTIRIEYSSELGVFHWDVPEGVDVTEAYWFAWKAFHPDTDIWHGPGAAAPAKSPSPAP
jgi:hypothetical protein